MSRNIKSGFLRWNFIQVADYKLFYHPKLNVVVNENSEKNIVLLGDLFDYTNETFSNKKIINELATSTTSFDELIEYSFKYSGTYIIIYFDKLNNELRVFNDNAAQREVYYLNISSSEMILGSQPNIINTIIPLEEDNSEEARLFFNSSDFNNRKSYVGNSTNFLGLKHLKPNHYLDIYDGKSIRFFPNEKLSKVSLSEGSERASKMIKGFVMAAAERYPLLIPVSAGWESRVLLAASKSIHDKCTYFVYKHSNMTDSHQDIAIPKKLFKKLGIDFNIIEYSDEIDNKYFNQIKDSIMFPRPNAFKYILNVLFKKYPKHLCLNGNVSEVGRKEHERIYNITPNKIALLQKYPNSSYAIKQYKDWLSVNMQIFDKFNYSVTDMLYWEENCGNWVAKGKTEVMTVSELFSPFNSRDLITTLLSVDEKYRGKQHPTLYRSITMLLWKDVLQVPVNPSIKLQVIKSLQKIGVYTLYRNILLSILVFVKSFKNKQLFSF